MKPFLKQSILIKGVSAVIIFVAFLFVFLNILVYFDIKNRFSVEKTPSLYLKPTNRTVLSNYKENINSKTYSPVAVSNIEFYLPWKISKQINAGDHFLFMSSKGQGVSIDIWKNSEKNNTSSDATLPLFKTYHDYNSCLIITPEDVTIFMPYRQIVKIENALIKKIILTAFGNNIYRFKINQIIGFQFNDASSDKRSEVHLFVNNDTKFRFKFYSSSQQDIDTVLSTIKSSKAEESNRNVDSEKNKKTGSVQLVPSSQLLLSMS